MIFKSETMVHNADMQYVPEWELNTDERSVTHFDRKLQSTKTYDFITDYARDHLSYIAARNPQKLQQLVNEGKIYDYLTDFEERAADAIDSQVERWKAHDKEYLLAAELGDIEKQARIENNFIARARELINDTIIYVI